MAVGTERLPSGRILLMENLNLARAEVPRIEGLGEDRAVFTIELEALMPIHAHGNGQIQMAERATGEFGFHEPAVSTGSF